ncbi:MAG: nucleotidyltransferase family protein [Ruminococcus sp.]|uniref:nucleotidyltransferase domain-containing protein n=1 Tax=Ruminococcus sp. TaxID=41978 RepID=UPI001B1FCFA0|nr:nucleotidyltransferase family protein [Ruminococcus sp.]MBO7474066.1 nucleotidyltransferase family protein [Ruminococcus sp.]
MEKREFRKNAADMIYLTACAVNSKNPKQERIEALDLPKLFEVSQEHILTACVAYALESVGIKDHDFTQAKEKAIRKNILLDAERRRILNRLEADKIWYMPLKGSILKDWYPKMGMRQMSDNDILFDIRMRSDVKKIMVDLGFELKLERELVDEYIKEPVYNFEMHSELFMEFQVGDMAEYYHGVKSRLLKDSDSGYGYHFSNEDFYLFMLAHEYKHYAFGGTGVRSLVDTYIFLRKFGNSLNWKYIHTELDKIGISDFERSNRELAVKVFSMKQLTLEDKKLLDYYVMSGTYGTRENVVENGIRSRGNGSKLRYFIHRIFPPVKYLKGSVPWVKKSKLLIPAAYIYRFFRGATINRTAVSDEFRQLGKKSK